MTANVTMPDGTEQALPDHLHEAHQKGTKGLTEEFLSNLHRTLHQPDRDSAPGHEHIQDEAPQDDAPDAPDASETPDDAAS